MNPVKNILVIVDPTASEHPAVEKAALLAQKLGARIELYVCENKAARELRLAKHARERPGEPFVTSVRALLEPLASRLRDRGLDVAVESECGDPLHIVLAERSKRTCADLVVKDTHHHSLLRRTIMTNTDWNLIRTCPVPLLLTKARPWGVRPRLLAAVDPSHANDKPAALDHRILEHASALAKALEGDLDVVHAYVPLAVIAAATGGTPPMAASVSPRELAAEEAERRAQVQALVGPYGVAPERVHLELGGPSDLIPRVAERIEADFVAMGAISRSGLKRVFLGATAEDVLEHLPCDALVIKPVDFGELLPI
jgi:universal stress protein E